MPLTIPATRSTVSPASDWVSGRITGIAPATAASKYRSTCACSAACASSPVDCASSALLAVTTDLPPEGRPGMAFACRLDRTHHLHDDVDVTGYQRVDVVGEHLDRHPAIGADVSHADAAQHQWCADAGRQIVGALLDDPDDLAADVAQTQYRYADRLFVSPALTTSQPTSRLNKSSTVSRRRISRAFPSRTTTTAGRPNMLYRLDIE